MVVLERQKLVFLVFLKSDERNISSTEKKHHDFTHCNDIFT